LGPRLVQEQPRVPDEFALEEPVPGGRHDLEEDTPIDPTEELARLRAQMNPPVFPPTAPPNPQQAQERQGEWVPLQSSWQPSAQTWKPLAERWGQAQTDPEPDQDPAPPPTFPPRSSPSGPVVLTQTASELDLPSVSVGRVEQVPAPAPQTTAAPAAAPATAPSRPWPLLPLVWFNAAFDLVLVPWGPPGRWLRGRPGRALLGTVGVLCLLGAAALAVADGVGWTW
jgi:hypothetical protein